MFGNYTEHKKHIVTLTHHIIHSIELTLGRCMCVRHSQYDTRLQCRKELALCLRRPDSVNVTTAH